MNIDKFKHQHTQILDCVSELRQLVRNGIGANALRIAGRIVAMSSVIKLHLAVEDRVLYPALQASNNAALARMSKLYQGEMHGIARAYLEFAGKWNTATQVQQEPEQFRSEANIVLKILFDRMKREDTEFYPAIDAAEPGNLAA